VTAARDSRSGTRRGQSDGNGEDTADGKDAPLSALRCRAAGRWLGVRKALHVCQGDRLERIDLRDLTRRGRGDKPGTKPTGFKW
jgi:hypothetical protein